MTKLKVQPLGLPGLQLQLSEIHNHLGIVIGYSDAEPWQWQLWAEKNHRFFDETRPLSPKFESVSGLTNHLKTHRAATNALLADFYAEGFDHGSGVRLPTPPEQRLASAEICRWDQEEAQRLRRRVQSQLSSLTASIAVDLRVWQDLGAEDKGIGAEMYLAEYDHGDWALTCGPMRLVMTCEQLHEVMRSALLALLGQPDAKLILAVLDRLPDGDATNEWKEAGQALWRACDSFRHVWPQRRGGYDDSDWGVPPPLGVTIHQPLGEDEFYAQPKRGSR